MAKHPSSTRTLRFLLVGGETLLGRELEEVLKTRLPGSVITAFSANGEGNFAEEEGEAVYREPLEPHSLDGENAVILAGSSEGALRAYDFVKKAGGVPFVIDCLGQIDQKAEARIVSPLAEEMHADSSWLRVLAHPAASALALVLKRLARRRAIRQAVVTIFEPASERGKRGAAELHLQITSLLSFKPLEKSVFDEQLGFNLLAAYGEDAPEKLIAIEQKVERHLATLLSRQSNGAGIPMPSLRLIQAPVFHGYSFSLWVEFDSHIEAATLSEALASAQIEVRSSNEETPHSVGAAGQSGLIAGDIRVDRNNPRAAWLWVVADNLRLTADACADLLSYESTKE